MLWVGLHLPRLSLESFEAGLAPEHRDEPLALVEHRRIVQANAAARALGVAAGQERATALALAPRLRLGQADAQRDAEALRGVAHTALAFTPFVVLPTPEPHGEPQHHVLLEVRASLRCFGGRDRLLERLLDALAPLGHELRVATAPTPQAAAWLAAEAAAGRPRHCADAAALQQALAQLPVERLGPAQAHWEALQGMGLRTLADLRQLPRSGLARRFGIALLDELDRAYGDKPDPRRPVLPPPVFTSRLELPMRADCAEQVLHAAALLLARLVAWAAAQHARVARWRLLMLHEPRRRAAQRRPAAAHTALEIALAEPSGDAAHLLLLLRERLAQVRLEAPTLELQLHCADIVRGAPPNGELFPSVQGERAGLTRLLERLQARLGREQVRRPVLSEDHRPEHACVMQAVDASQPMAAPRRAAARPGAEPQAALPAARPVWLLAQPEPLPEHRHQPWLGGAPLVLLRGPERIETGWWDGAPAARDYFIAQQADGSLVWIFRGRLPFGEAGTPSGWFLQGRFG